MKIKFYHRTEKEMFRIVPIGFSISRRDIPNRHAFYIGCEWGYERFCIQFKWYTKNRSEIK